MLVRGVWSDLGGTTEEEEDVVEEEGVEDDEGVEEEVVVEYGGV